VSGYALLSLLEPHQPGVARFQAELSGLQPGSAHSFHFHSWGDMTVDLNDGSLGPIYMTNAIDVEKLHVNNRGIGQLEVDFRSSSLEFDWQRGGATGLQRHVGRSLTLHAGPSSSTPTIAAAVCGIAHPHVAFATDIISTSAPSTLSPGVVFLCVLTGLVVFTMLFVATLYYLRYPIPLIGRWLYQGNYHATPPPPHQVRPMMVAEKL